PRSLHPSQTASLLCTPPLARRALRSFPTRRSSDLLRQVALQLADGDSHLLHGVPLPDGDAVVGGGVLVPHGVEVHGDAEGGAHLDRKSTRLNSSHVPTSYAVFCLKNTTSS